MFVDSATIQLLLPECLLVLTATSIYVAGAFFRAPTAWPWMAVVAYAAAVAVLLGTDPVLGGVRSESANSLLAVDFLGCWLRLLALLTGFLLTLMAWRAAGHELASEYLGTLTLVTAGIMLVARANELALLFLGLELVTIPTYVLLFLGRRDRAAAEATVKYFFLSLFASALLLYGFSFLYGLAGTTTVTDAGGAGIREVLGRLAADEGSPWRGLGSIAVVLIVCGLAFKIAAVPFHFYAPDVYQGTTNANAGLLAVAPKIAGIVALVRLIVVAVGGTWAFGWVLAMVLAMATMTLGNVCALWQQNLRRLMAYSSIAHAGYMLIGLTVALAATEMGVSGSGGVAGMLLYLLVYVFASLGIFAALCYLGSDEREISGVDELAGLAQTRPLAAGAVAVCLFSLAGIPPLAGFWGKLALFRGAIQLATTAMPFYLSFWLAVLAIVGAVNAAIAAAYYLRIVAAMYFRDPSGDVPAGGGWGPGLATGICAVLVLVIGAMPSTAVHSAGSAEQSISPAASGNTRSSDRTDEITRGPRENGLGERGRPKWLAPATNTKANPRAGLRTGKYQADAAARATLRSPKHNAPWYTIRV